MYLVQVDFITLCFRGKTSSYPHHLCPSPVLSFPFNGNKNNDGTGTRTMSPTTIRGAFNLNVFQLIRTQLRPEFLICPLYGQPKNFNHFPFRRRAPRKISYLCTFFYSNHILSHSTLILVVLLILLHNTNSLCISLIELNRVSVVAANNWVTWNDQKQSAKEHVDYLLNRTYDWHDTLAQFHFLVCGRDKPTFFHCSFQYLLLVARKLQFLAHFILVTDSTPILINTCL